MSKPKPFSKIIGDEATDALCDQRSVSDTIRAWLAYNRLNQADAGRLVDVSHATVNRALAGAPEAERVLRALAKVAL